MIELDNTTINIINDPDTFQLEFVKSKGSYTEKAADSLTYSCGSAGYYGQIGRNTFHDQPSVGVINQFINDNVNILFGLLLVLL